MIHTVVPKEVRNIRDEIERRVGTLLDELLSSDSEAA